MGELNMLYGEPYRINDHIIINSPTLREIKEFGEEQFFSTVLTLCQTPSDCKVFLNDKLNKDWQEVEDFDLFSLFAPTLPLEQTQILFGDFDFTKLRVAEDTISGEIVLLNPENGAKIDSAIYFLITKHLRETYRLTRSCDKAGNEITKKFFLDEQRTQIERQKKEKFKSVLSPLISGLVNCEHFKYNYTTVLDLSVYTFMDAVKQILKYQQYIQVMQGAYAGTIDLSKIPQKTLNWLSTG